MRVFFSLLMFMQISLAGDCYMDHLLANGSDGNVFTLHVNEVENLRSGPLDPIKSIHIVKKVLDHPFCQNQNAELNASTARCSSELGRSLCRVDSRWGYFIIHRDYLDGLQIIFARWD